MSRQARRALIAETAFHAVAAGHDRVLFPEAYEAEQAAREFINSLMPEHPDDQQLDQSEWAEAGGMIDVLVRFVGGLSSPTFLSIVPGCGVVDAAIADILDGGHLIEVKAVNRGVQTGDLRQLLTYAAMLYADGVTVNSLTWLNPRRARYWTHSLTDIAYGASGAPTVGLLQDIADLMVGLQVSA